MLKEVNLILFFLFASIVNFTFLFVSVGQVVGQINSSSSSSGLFVCVCALPRCSSGQVLSVPKDPCKECPKCISISSSSGEITSSSSSGDLTCLTDSDCSLGTCPDGKTFQNYSCLDGKCHELNFFADPCLFHSASSSSGGAEITLNKNFTGLWKAKTQTILSVSSSSGTGEECIICTQVVPDCKENEILIPQSCNKCAHCEKSTKSRIIILKLCVKNGVLEGKIDNGEIISRNNIAENKVEVTFKNKDSADVTLTLELVGSRLLKGTLSDSNSFNARKISLLKSCTK